MGKMETYRQESDSMGEINVPADRLWGAQTQRSLKYFSIGRDLIPKEMVIAYAQLKKAAAIVNAKDQRITNEQKDLIVKACDEILSGSCFTEFPLHVWMTGSGTQFNMNVNEVIANLCCRFAGQPLGSKNPVHPNDHVNMSQSSNDTFPTAMYIAAASETQNQLLPAIKALKEALEVKAESWKDIVKIGRTHMQDATPMTLGQEFSGYAALLEDHLARLNQALEDVSHLVIGGTAIGTGINAQPGFDKKMVAELSKIVGIPFQAASNKFALMGSHDALIHLSGALKALACSLFKIANDIRLISSGPRAGIYEISLPANEPGSSIMPGKVNPTQCEALTMVAIQVMANDAAVSMAGAGGILEMNTYKPIMIYNIIQSIQLLSDASTNFRKYLIEGMEANVEEISQYVERSLMLVTALSPVIGYDKASEVAHHAHKNALTLKEAATKLGYVTEEEYDRHIDPKKMIAPAVQEN